MSKAIERFVLADFLYAQQDHRLNAIGMIATVILTMLVTVFIVTLDDDKSAQKIAQIVIIWLVSLVGVIGLWLFHRDSGDGGSGGESFGGDSNDSLGVQ